MEVHHVSVDRSRNPKELLDSTSRVQYVDKDMIATMPRGEGQWAQVHFFDPDPSVYDEKGRLSDEALAEEFERLNLNPADAYSLAACHLPDGAVATHWKVDQGWCHNAYVKVGREYRVHLNLSTKGWGRHWKFAGIPK